MARLVDTGVGGPDELLKIRSTGAGRVHFCHHTDVIHS
jgi:hypothetical protein